MRVAMPLDGFVVVAGAAAAVVVVVVVPAVVDGTGSKYASTQYECPACSVPQLAGMDGFWWWR